MATNVSPRRPISGSQARADRTCALVIDETVRCVLEEGFAAASAKHITERAGVTWGVIQYHFGDRDGLLMAVIDQGFSQLHEALGKVESTLAPVDGRTKTELLVNAVWEAFSSPTSVAALEILIATRTTRSAWDKAHLVELFSSLTQLGRYASDTLDFTHADLIGELIWTALEGLILAQMVMGKDVDTSRQRRALTESIAAYIAQHDTNTGH